LVGIFHTYAHVIECQVLFSPRTIEGAGIADGEGTERVWSKTRHQIPAGRVSAYDTRIAILTHQFVQIGREIDWEFPSSSRIKFSLLLDRIKETERKIESLCGLSSLTVADLQCQADSMRDFYSQKVTTQAQLEDDIAEHLIAIEDMGLFLKARQAVLKVCGREWMDLKIRIAYNTNGRIDPTISDHEIETLNSKVDDLLMKANQARSDWLNDDGSKTSLFLDRALRLRWYGLYRKKEEIKRLLIARRMEKENISESSTQG